MEKNKRGRGVERGERFRRIDFSSPPPVENQSTFSGLAGGNRRCLLTRPLVAAPPDGVHTVACRPNGRCLRVAYPGYIIRQRQSPAIQLGCPSLVLVHAPSIRSMMYHLVLAYENKSSWRSNSASDRLGRGPNPKVRDGMLQGRRCPSAARQMRLQHLMLKTAWDTFDATKGQVLADREIF